MRRLWISLLITVAVAVGGLAGVLASGLSPHLGLDLSGGASVVYSPVHRVSNAKLNEAINIIRNRVDALGVAEPNIGQEGSDIVVQLPGVKNPNQALSIIGQTAQLSFRSVLCEVPPFSAKGKPASTATQPVCSSQEQAGGQAPLDASLASYPTTSCSNPNVEHNVIYPLSSSASAGGAPGYRYVLGPQLADGSIISNASPGLVQNSGQWAVNFTLTSAGQSKFNVIATSYYQRQVAIALDCSVQSAPAINSKTFPGSGQITGSFTQSQASSLALVLRYGALPVQLKQQNVQTVSPTLGKSSLNAGLAAGIGGLLLVLLYTIFYYRALGLVVLSGLAVTAGLLWAIVSVLGHTSGLALDLSGVTGLIVSIGVTVDSYIVYFERLKDDVRSGRTIRSSVDRGFSRAYRTVLAADAVSFIAALLLYLLTIGPVRGFAFFLGLSTILDVVVTYFFTRPIVILMGRNRMFTEARWIGVARGLAPKPIGVGAEGDS